MSNNVAAVGETSRVTTTTSRPRLVNPNIHTIEITDKFRDAASRLPAGSLIKDEYFTLFESVGALEIGDPKMDSGCGDEGIQFDDDFDVCRPLSHNEVIWLMDELLSREVAWHMGYPLSQTLFTSIYIETLLWPDPTQLRDAQFSKDAAERDLHPVLHRVFRSYCLSLIKCCDLVLGMVVSQHYYEEEDFATQLYNRELLHRFSVSDILIEMEDAFQYLHHTSLDATIKQSLEARMKFRFDFLTMLSSHTRAGTRSSLTHNVDQALLTSIRDSRTLGVPLPDSFTLKIQKRLTSTVPPRPMVTIDVDRTFDYLNQFVRDCETVFLVLRASSSHDLLATYSIFNSQDPQPSIYIRALMQSWLNRDDLVGGISNEFDFVLDDIQSITLAASPIIQALRLSPENLTSALKLVRLHVNEFMAKNGRCFLNIWRTACLNRCRVRRTLCHAAIEWDQIQAEAEELDDELQNILAENAAVYPAGGVPTFSYSLSSWVYHYKLIQLRQIAQLGFELDIYAPHELPSMYWYLAHLCDTHLAHLERISFFTLRRKAALQPSEESSAHDSAEAESCTESLRLLYRQFSWLKATEATARALHRLYIVLQRHGHFNQTSTTYASDSLRYELRMRPFFYLSVPEPLDFEQCRRRCQMQINTDLEILEEATSYIATARKGWDEVMRAKWHAIPLKQSSDGNAKNIIEELWAADIRGAIKATISASIAIATLKKNLTDGIAKVPHGLKAAMPLKGEKDHFHSWWLVPRLIRS